MTLKIPKHTDRSAFEAELDVEIRADFAPGELPDLTYTSRNTSDLEPLMSVEAIRYTQDPSERY